jgi:hypothetical protein
VVDGADGVDGGFGKLRGVVVGVLVVVGLADVQGAAGSSAVEKALAGETQVQTGDKRGAALDVTPHRPVARKAAEQTWQPARQLTTSRLCRAARAGTWHCSQMV